ncbi:hypothetical protein DFS34DRAFT_18261 [Phlyctochytrium arcticum]|nr:hypothetical protein DFS34DRAFT_18261 [Phlyctochytrium arcticum]
MYISSSEVHFVVAARLGGYLAVLLNSSDASHVLESIDLVHVPSDNSAVDEGETVDKLAAGVDLRFDSGSLGSGKVLTEGDDVLLNFRDVHFVVAARLGGYLAVLLNSSDASHVLEGVDLVHVPSDNSAVDEGETVDKLAAGVDLRFDSGSLGSGKVLTEGDDVLLNFRDVHFVVAARLGGYLAVLLNSSDASHVLEGVDLVHVPSDNSAVDEGETVDKLATGVDLRLDGGSLGSGKVLAEGDDVLLNFRDVHFVVAARLGGYFSILLNSSDASHVLEGVDLVHVPSDNSAVDEGETVDKLAAGVDLRLDGSSLGSGKVLAEGDDVLLNFRDVHVVVATADGDGGNVRDGGGLE